MSKQCIREVKALWFLYASFGAHNAMNLLILIFFSPFSFYLCLPKPYFNASVTETECLKQKEQIVRKVKRRKCGHISGKITMNEENAR
jgi:hypothetical protein